MGIRLKTVFFQKKIRTRLNTFFLMKIRIRLKYILSDEEQSQQNEQPDRMIRIGLNRKEVPS